MSLYSALVVQNQENDIRCEVYGQHKETKLYAGAINLYHGGFFHTTLFSSDPIFDTPENAITCMERCVKKIRATNYFAPRKVPAFDPGDLLDMEKAPWPDE